MIYFTVLVHKAVFQSGRGLLLLFRGKGKMLVVSFLFGAFHRGSGSDTVEIRCLV